MNIIRKFVPAGNDVPVTGGNAFKDDKVRRIALRCSSARPDRSGEIVEQSGIDLINYRRNPVVLWQHNHGSPIARATSVGVIGGYLECEVEFPPPGVSALSDQIYGLVRADIVKGVSIGFQPMESQPLDKGNPVKGPQRYIRSELWEISIVAVPANSDGCVTWKFAQGGEMARRRAVVAKMRKDHERTSLHEIQRRQVEVLRLAVTP